MPKVSVCVPTMRCGGLDVLVAGLTGQTFKDFELVICDALWNWRQGIFDEVPFMVKHLPPRPGGLYVFPTTQFCRQANTALAAASGEIVLFITDYTWLPPDCLERHVRFHEEQVDGNGVLMLAHEYRVPQFSPRFPKYQNADTNLYVEDLAFGRLGTFKWSTFEDLGDPESYPKDTTQDWDPKSYNLPGPCDPSYFHGKNESMLLKWAIEANGWNEALDGTHCYQDTEFADRLAKLFQLDWQVGLGSKAIILNPRGVFPWGRRLRPVESNHALWQYYRGTHFKGPVNSWLLSTGESHQAGLESLREAEAFFEIPSNWWPGHDR